LDAEIERQIQSSLASIGCTRIVVAHRLSTVRGADLILVLDEGRLIESGTHRELLDVQGTYAQLAKAQLSGEALS
jgi:ABC-type multidrug transport system fused ATPase/permease subunit